MLGKEVPQPGFFDLDMLGSLLDPIVPPDSFHARLAQERGELFRDDDFAKLYCLDNGRPSVPPSRLAVLLLLQAHDGASDREAISRMKADLRWKYAIGLAIDEVLCSRGTLVHFRARLHLHEGGEAIFQRIIERAQERGVLQASGSKAKIVLDTTPVFGRGAVEDTYNLVSKGIKKLARTLARVADAEPQEWAQRHGLERYHGSSIKGQAAIDWSDPEARRQFLESIVADADRLLEIARTVRKGLKAGSPLDKTVEEAAELLVSLLQQDIERRDDGPVLRKGVAKDRIVSVHDPDSDGALDLVDSSEETAGIEVEETIGDCAYGDVTTRQEFKDAGRALVAKAPRSPTTGVFPKERFELDLEAGTCTCPAGQVTETLRGAGQFVDRNGKTHVRRQFVFPAAVCQVCPLRARCTRSKTGGRTIQVHPLEVELQAARKLQLSPAFGEYRQARQLVEHRNARLMQLGMRQSRYFGRKKTRLQLLLAASVANLTLIWTIEENQEGTVPPKGRLTEHFKKLASWFNLSVTRMFQITSAAAAATTRPL